MLIFIYLYILIVGLIIGSFINALEYRIEKNMSIRGRSLCPNCKHQLTWFDLIPVVSYISLIGKCRYCKKKISIQYPLVEVLTAFSFVILAYKTPYLSSLLSALQTGNYHQLFFSLSSLLLVLYIGFVLLLNALYDFKTGYLLSKHLYLAMIASFVLLVLNYPSAATGLFTFLSPNLMAAILPAAFFYLLYFVSKERWMGLGDTELVFLLGLFLGFPNILITLYFAFIVGSIIGLVRIGLKKSKMTSEIPFGPLLIAGGFFALVFGSQIVSFYVRIFLGG